MFSDMTRSGSDHSGSDDSGSDDTGHGRSVTMLPEVTKRRGRLPVQIDPRSGEPSGPWHNEYRNYIGMLAKTKIPIVIPCWDGVMEVDKNLLWQDIVVCLLKPTIIFIMLLNT